MKSLFISFVRFVQKLSVKRQMKGQEKYREGVSRIFNVKYADGNNKRHILDIHYPTKNNKLLPVIINFHGGAFIGGEKWYNTEHCEVLASNNFLVFNVEYTRTPNINIFDEIKESFIAIDWIMKNLEKYHGDKSKITLMGDSAGSWMISMFQIVNNSTKLQKIYKVSRIDLDIKSNVLISPVMNVEKAMTPPCHIFWFRPYVYSLKNSKKYPLNLTSFQNVINEYKIPNCLIVTSKGDSNYYCFAKELKNLLKKSDINYEYLEYENGERILEHCFNIMHPSYPESIDANKKIIDFINKCN